ncbi:MAG: hypothetical protein HY657_11120 [Acidobacteria bacterium]|nr:hypothetical protein [Acidobacteriota bacterium]
MIQALRFFHVVRPWHPMMPGAFGIALGATGVVLMLDGGTRTAGPLAPIFLLQALTTSSGFATPARRGHYDLLLTSGQGRVRIGVAHWLMSVAPGVATWLALAALELAFIGGPAQSLTSGTVAGMILVSALPWAATVALPRLTGGLVWITLLVLVVSVMPGSTNEIVAEWQAADDGPIVRTLAVLVCPWILAGRDLRGPDLLPAAAAIAFASLAVVAAVAWIARSDFPLEAGQ